MSKKLTAAALAALMMLGMTGCSSGNNMARDSSRYFGTENYNTENYGTENYGTGEYGTGEYGGSGIFRSRGNSAAGDDDSRYRDMLENGRVHDSDGYLLDGENRHD